MFWPVTVLQGSAQSFYSVQVDAPSNIGVFLSSVGKCWDCKSEQWVNIKFPVKLKKSVKETFQFLTEAYSEDRMSRARVLEWHKRFLECRESLKNDDRPGCPHTAVTNENTEKSVRCDSKRPKVACSSSSWGSQFGQGKCSTNSKGGDEHEKGFCKNGSKSGQTNKKNVARNWVWTFAMHWEWTRFVEFYN